MISVFSHKPVFGQCGPLIYIFRLTQQTVSRKSNNFHGTRLAKANQVKFKSLLLNTLNNFVLFFVKILAILDNPLITNARSISYKLRITEFSLLSLPVEISETIRLLSTIYLQKFNPIKFIYFYLLRILKLFLFISINFIVYILSFTQLDYQVWGVIFFLLFCFGFFFWGFNLYVCFFFFKLKYL